MKIRSPMAALLDESDGMLAERLLDEVGRGMEPVWPTTERYADKMVRGLEGLLPTRRREVHRAILTAPADSALGWRMRLMPLLG